jgi:hypothetical protein
MWSSLAFDSVPAPFLVAGERLSMGAEPEPYRSMDAKMTAVLLDLEKPPPWSMGNKRSV